MMVHPWLHHIIDTAGIESGGVAKNATVSVNGTVPGSGPGENV